MVIMERCLTLSKYRQLPYQQTLLKVRSTLCVRCCVQIWFFSKQHFPRNVYNIIDHWPLCAVLCETYDIGCIHRKTTNSWLVWIFYILISKWWLMVGVGFLNYFNISLHSKPFMGKLCFFCDFGQSKSGVDKIIQYAPAFSRLDCEHHCQMVCACNWLLVILRFFSRQQGLYWLVFCKTKSGVVGATEVKWEISLERSAKFRHRSGKITLLPFNHVLE